MANGKKINFSNPQSVESETEVHLYYEFNFLFTNQKQIKQNILAEIKKNFKISNT